MGNSDKKMEIEATVCKVSDLEDGKSETMKEVDLGEEGKCLVVRNKDGSISALGHKCTHYGAPLIKGVLSNGRIRCPWHGACFSSHTGDIEDFPGLDSLHKFQVTVRRGNVIVKAKKSQLLNNKKNVLTEKIGDSACTDPSNEQRVVIVGGGPSSLTCAETLRKEGFSGRILILSKENHPPYDRPKLSKALDIEPEKAYLRSDGDYYRSIGIELYNNTEVTGVNIIRKSVDLAKPLQGSSATGNNRTVAYDKLVIATGGEPRTLAPAPGWDLKNVFVLRSPDDANAIATASKDKHVVVIGSSFIGMEVTSFLASHKIPASISVVCGRRSKVPFQGSLGAQVGNMIMQVHQERGVTFYTEVGVSSLMGGGKEEYVVKQITLTDGSVIDADVVVVGIGVNPATGFLKNSELRCSERGFIAVDARMQTKTPSVYAVGDVALFPLGMKGGEMANIQHWQMAHSHGRIAAVDIAKSLRRSNDGIVAVAEAPSSGKSVKSIPFFWTVQYGSSIRYAGHGAGYDDISICGNLPGKKFAAYYLKCGVVVAIATMNADPLAAQMAERLAAGEVMKKEDIPDCLG